MSGAVKGNDRNRRAMATRRRIVHAAAALFVAQGYASTTLEQVARLAGVAVQTVYFHFGNKRTVLKEAVDAAAGDDGSVVPPEQPWFEEIRTEPDPLRMIELWMVDSRTTMERIGPIMGVVRDAAATDPDMAAQWAANEERRATAFAMLAGLLAERSALRVPVDEATDIIAALLSLEIYALLTRRGWTPLRWQRWATDALAAGLLR